MMLTLWDLIDPLLNKIVPPSKTAPQAKAPTKLAGPAAPNGAGVGGTVNGMRIGGEPGAPAPAGPRTRRRVRPQPPQRPNHQHPTQHSVAKQLIAIAEPPPATAKRPRITRNGNGVSGETADASMQARYDAVVEQMLAQYGIRVRKWRKSMSGVAWYVTYRDGRMQRLIESPRPRGPMSAAVFLHEIGHHAIGFDVYKPRCLEEYHAWRWSLEAMQQHGLNITDAVRHRVHRSLWYAVQKAKRRGIRSIPQELAPFLEKPAARRGSIGR